MGTNNIHDDVYQRYEEFVSVAFAKYTLLQRNFSNLSSDVRTALSLSAFLLFIAIFVSLFKLFSPKKQQKRKLKPVEELEEVDGFDKEVIEKIKEAKELLKQHPYYKPKTRVIQKEEEEEEEEIEEDVEEIKEEDVDEEEEDDDFVLVGEEEEDEDEDEDYESEDEEDGNEEDEEGESEEEEQEQEEEEEMKKDNSENEDEDTLRRRKKPVLKIESIDPKTRHVIVKNVSSLPVPLDNWRIKNCKYQLAQKFPTATLQPKATFTFKPRVAGKNAPKYSSYWQSGDHGDFGNDAEMWLYDPDGIVVHQFSLAQ